MSGPGPHRSLWLREALAAVRPAPPLAGTHRTGVAVVGGGYTGLWAAIRIKEAAPEVAVTILEQDRCGGGASGRNGGFVLPWWPKLQSLISLFGRDDGLALAADSDGAIDDLERFGGETDVDFGFRRSGWLWTATTGAQVAAWEPVVRMCEAAGLDVFRRLPSGEVADRAGSRSHLAGVFVPGAGLVDPARLAVALRERALALGVAVFEHTKVTAIRSKSSPVRISAGRGSVAADKVVVATNAWAAGMRFLRSALVVVSSDIVATAPIPERLEEIGWTGGEGVTNSQAMIDYYRTSDDGRIVFGKGGWGLALGGRIGARFDRHDGRARMVEADFRHVYPQLADVPVIESWSGPIDRSVSGLPILGHMNGRRDVLYGVGWSGNGVGPCVLGGRILASLALERDDEWSRSPLVDQDFERFPPNPIRSLGAVAVRAAVRRKESLELRERHPGRLTSWVAGLAPSGLEDH